MLICAHVLLRARLAAMKERGASAVEYGLLIAGIAAVVVSVILLLGGNVLGLFEDANGALEDRDE